MCARGGRCGTRDARCPVGELLGQMRGAQNMSRRVPGMPPRFRHSDDARHAVALLRPCRRAAACPGSTGRRHDTVRIACDAHLFQAPLEQFGGISQCGWFVKTTEDNLPAIEPCCGECVPVLAVVVGQWTTRRSPATAGAVRRTVFLACTPSLRDCRGPEFGRAGAVGCRWCGLVRDARGRCGGWWWWWCKAAGPVVRRVGRGALAGRVLRRRR